MSSNHPPSSRMSPPAKRTVDLRRPKATAASRRRSQQAGASHDYVATERAYREFLELSGMPIRARIASFANMRSDVMPECPGDVQHFYLKGLLFIAVGMLAAMSMTFFLYMALNGSSLGSNIAFPSWDQQLAASSEPDSSDTTQSPTTDPSSGTPASPSSSPSPDAGPTTVTPPTASPAPAPNPMRWGILFLSALFGAFWGLFCIVGIDRYLTHSMEGLRGFWSNFLHSLPRLLLAAVLGLLVSTPLTLQIFHQDITTQLAISITNRLNVIVTDYQTSPEMRAVTAARKAIDDAPANAQSQKQQEIDNLQASVTAAQQTAENDRQAFLTAQQLYFDAFNGSTCKNGVGRGECSETTRLAMLAAYEKWCGTRDTTAPCTGGTQGTANALQKSLTDLIESNTSADTSGLDQNLGDAENALRNLASSKKMEYDQVARDTGVLAQIEAEWGPGMSLAMKISHGIVMLAFFFIEIIPVFGQGLWNMRGTESTYEELCRLRDAETTAGRQDRQKAEEREREEWWSDHFDAFVAQSKVQTQASKDMARRQLENQKRANELIAARYWKHLKAAIDDWERNAGDPAVPSVDVHGDAPLREDLEGYLVGGLGEEMLS